MIKSLSPTPGEEGVAWNWGQKGLVTKITWGRMCLDEGRPWAWNSKPFAMFLPELPPPGMAEACEDKPHPLVPPAYPCPSRKNTPGGDMVAGTALGASMRGLRGRLWQSAALLCSLPSAPSKEDGMGRHRCCRSQLVVTVTRIPGRNTT